MKVMKMKQTILITIISALTTAFSIFIAEATGMFEKTIQISQLIEVDQQSHMFEKLLSWAMFSVLLALIPIFFSALQRLIRGHSFKASELIENGELLIVSATLSAGAVGELVNGISKYSIFSTIVLGSTIILLIVSAMAFATIVTARYDTEKVQLNYRAISIMSIVLFSLSVVSSGSCITLGRV